MHIVTHRPGRFIGDIIAEVAIMAFLLLLNQLVDNQTGSEFGLEPGGFRGHDVAGVGYVHQLLHRNWVKRQGHGHLPGVDAAFEFTESADTAYEVDALVGTEIVDTEDVAQNQVG